MNVSSIMTRDVISVRPDTPLRDVIKLIVKHGFSGVPVTDDSGKLVGIVSEKDVLLELLPSYCDFMSDPVAGMQGDVAELKKEKLDGLVASDIMTTKVLTVRREVEVIKASGLMTARRVRRLPVVDHTGRLVGIISKGDAFRALLQYASEIS